MFAKFGIFGKHVLLSLRQGKHFIYFKNSHKVPYVDWSSHMLLHEFLILKPISTTIEPLCVCLFESRSPGFEFPYIANCLPGL